MQAFFHAQVETGSIIIDTSRCPAWNIADPSEPWRVDAFDPRLVDDVLSFLGCKSIPSTGLCDLAVCRPATPTVLSQALIHRKLSLVSLKLKNQNLTEIIQTCPSIASLSLLTFLGLRLPNQEKPEICTISSTIHTLAHAISQLPHLASADIYMMTLAIDDVQEPPTAAQRSPKIPIAKLASADPAHPAYSFDPVLGALSQAPSLSTLTLCSGCSPFIDIYGLEPIQRSKCPWAPLPCTGLQGPFLHLQNLRVRQDDIYSPGITTHHAVDPVVHLPALTSYSVSSGTHLQASWRVVQGLLLQTTLTQLEMTLTLLDRSSAQLLATQLHSLTALVQLSVTLSNLEQNCNALGVCTGVKYLRYTAPECVHDALRGISQLPLLTKLQLHLPGFRFNQKAVWNKQHTRTHLLTPLSILTGLRSLRMVVSAMAFGGPRGDVHAALVSLNASALPALTMLTFLKVAAVPEEGLPGLTSEALTAVSKLHLLRHLKLDALEFQDHLQVQTLLLHVCHSSCFSVSQPPSIWAQPILQYPPSLHTCRNFTSAVLYMHAKNKHMF